MIAAELQETIIRHFTELNIWKDVWGQSAVVIVGSSVHGIDDEFADIDILAFVPQPAYPAIYEDYRSAISEGRLQTFNAIAFQYDEFPLMLIPSIHGHYQVHRFEEVEERTKQYDDVVMWIHGSARILHDPSGRYGALREQARTYPENLWKQKVRSHFLSAWKAAVAASNPLRRGDRPGVVLTMTNCIAHLLRLCCLLERRPFPYDKWLYQEAMRTRAGQDLQPLFDNFLVELGHPQIRRIEPVVFERPGHRNADLEYFPLHVLWRQAKANFDHRLSQ